MWAKKEKKTLFTLCVDNYAPEITALTFPLLRHYAKKIGADFHIIKDRKFPGFPPVYEKFQIYELAQQMENDWNLYVDADALIHPECIDFTNYLPRDTVAHKAFDISTVRFTPDRFFKRDGRFLGSGNWFAIASDWCIELWKPLDDLTLEEAVARINPMVNELIGKVNPSHLIDDFTCSRNIAKYGLKARALQTLLHPVDMSASNQWWHVYNVSEKSKLEQMKSVLGSWKIAAWAAKQ